MLVRRLAYSSLLLFLSLSLRAQVEEKQDSLVRLLGCDELQQVEERGESFRKALGAARFEHNSTLLLCDTALWNVNLNVINAFGNVKILQDETVLESDRLDYYVDENLAQFRGTLVQLQDKDGNILRTRNLDYNTRDSVATFYDGGAFRDKDGQLIESRFGSYDSKLKLFAFNQDVNMYTDSVFVKTESLDFNTLTSIAVFGKETYVWKDDNQLAAQAGNYNRLEEVFLFHDKVHLLTKDQEAWSDSLRYYKLRGDIEMFGNVELLDTTRDVAAVAGYARYVDSLSMILMARDPAVIAISTQDNRRDTSYVGADTLIYRTFPKCDIVKSVLSESEARLKSLDVDPIAEYRRKAAEQAKASAMEAERTRNEEKGKPAPRGGAPGAQVGPGERRKGPILPAPEDEWEALQPPRFKTSESIFTSPRPLSPQDTTAAKARSETEAPASQAAKALLPASADTLSSELGAAADSLVSLPDTLLAASDSLKTALADSLAALPRDSTKVGFLTGKRNVRVFRSDIQVACDSLAYTDLDSLVRLYQKPVVWNEVRRQYSADSIAIVVKNEAVQKASLMSNAFIIVQEDSLCYDQIRGAEMMAYFDSTGALRRFDAMGGASGLFYIEENDALATANRFEAKMLTATFLAGEIQDLNYFDGVKSDAFPVVQLAADEKYLKGYEWQPERRPKSPEDITTLKPRESQRAEYEDVPRAQFNETETYFPGYMASVYQLLARQDSLKRVRQAERRRLKRLQEEEARMLADSLQLASAADSLKLAAAADSLKKAAADSLALAGSLPEAGSDASSAGTQADSLSSAGSLSPPDGPVSKEVERARRNIAKAGEKARRKAAQEQRRTLRDSTLARKQREKEALWAAQDSIDAAKAKVKAEKVLEKKRIQTAKTLKAAEKTAAKEQRVLERYAARFEKRKARLDARAVARKASQAAKDSKQRTSKPETLPKRQDEEMGDQAKPDELGDPAGPDKETR